MSFLSSDQSPPPSYKQWLVGLNLTSEDMFDPLVTLFKGFCQPLVQSSSHGFTLKHQMVPQKPTSPYPIYPTSVLELTFIIYAPFSGHQPSPQTWGWGYLKSRAWGVPWSLCIYLKLLLPAYFLGRMSQKSKPTLQVQKYLWIYVKTSLIFGELEMK